MLLQEALKSGKPFKRQHWDCWYIVKTKNPKSSFRLYCKKHEDFLQVSLEDILANDWITKGEWYEGDFKKKYPNGVYCVILDKGSLYYNKVTIIYNYDITNAPFPFMGQATGYQKVRPATKEEVDKILPAIIG